MTVTADMSSASYHALPSLSASGAKILLQEGGPAKYQWQRRHRRPDKHEYDFGSAVHAMVLGVGEPIKPLPFKAWNERGAKAAKEKARAEGYVPLKVADYWSALRAANAVRQHPTAGRIFAAGVAEQPIEWADPETGVQMRCRPDWYRPGLIVDLKTASDASPTGFGRDANKFNYPQAAAVYLDGVRHVYGDEAAYVLVVVETEPPYYVAVYEIVQTDDHGNLTDEYRVGYEKYRRAVEIFRDCTESGHWPAYGDDIQPLKLSKWSTIDWDNQQ